MYTLPKITPEQLLVEVQDVLRTMPDRTKLTHELPENEAWLGRVAAVVNIWDTVRGTLLLPHVQGLVGYRANNPAASIQAILTTLHQLQHETRMATTGPLTVVIGTSRPFHYFDEIRKIIEKANTDVFFVDPYLDADFVSTYLPHVKANVQIRLLGRVCKTLEPAVKLFRNQEGAKIELRTIAGFHDRYVFTDHRECYQSGASFKDGAKASPTTLTQITDAFDAMASTYENLWSRAKHL